MKYGDTCDYTIEEGEPHVPRACKVEARDVEAAESDPEEGLPKE
jgi:hypothetical protein